jgi:DNA-binding NarL/FixJ family response regulator
MRCRGANGPLALVDLKMPGPSVSRRFVAARTRARHSRPGLHELRRRLLIRATLDAGATGFLIKDALKDDLLKAIRSVAAGQPYSRRLRRDS